MSNFEPSIPAYYVVSKKLTFEQVQEVRRAFLITPISAVIITDPRDYEQAVKIHDHVSRVTSYTAAHDVAKQVYQETSERTAIIGDAVLLDSYDKEGTLQVRPEWSED